MRPSITTRSLRALDTEKFATRKAKYPVPQSELAKPSEKPYVPAPTGPRGSKEEHARPGPKGKGVDPLMATRIAAFRVKHHTDQATTDNSLISRIHSRLPVPHPKQLEIELSSAKRKVINCGRRAGKTTGAARVAIIKMCEGRRVLLASTTQDQADAFWEKCKVWLDPFIKAGDLEKNETRRIMDFALTGGRIKVKTASDADMLRGDYADFLVLDECALLAPNAWEEVGAPMLLDNDGDAWFLSTPRRRNWFYTLYQRAAGDQTGRWAKFHFTSMDNPHLSEDALSEIIADLNDEAYKQEILAVFLEGEGAVFRNITSCMTADPHPSVLSHQNHFIVMGVDWAQKHDYTVICTFCATCRRELQLDRFNLVEWALQRERLVSAHRKWSVRYTLAEENSIGGPNIEALNTEDHLYITPFTTTMNSKGQLIRSLALAFERSEVQFIENPVSTAELEAYEATVSRITGHISYSAPKGLKDDTVMARALAYYAAITGQPIMSPQARSYETPAFGGMVYDMDDVPMEGYYGEGSPAFKSYDKYTLPGMR